LSAPVLDGDGRLSHALTVIGSTGAIDVAADGPVARALLAAAHDIAAQLAAAPTMTASSPS
jgi:DNA-binding IclR family transcriptional regulator